MFHILDSKPASGEMLLYHEWKEDHAGYNDEVITDAKLEAGLKGEIILRITEKYTSYAPKGGGGNTEETIYSISVQELTDFFEKNGTKTRRIV